MPRVWYYIYMCIFIRSVKQKTASFHFQAKRRGTTERNCGKYRLDNAVLLMWKASPEVPDLGASSRDAPETFITLRPTQSSKRTWRFSYSSNVGTESNKRDGHGGKRVLIRYLVPGIYCVVHKIARARNRNRHSSTWLMRFDKGIELNMQAHRRHERDTQSPS